MRPGKFSRDELLVSLRGLFGIPEQPNRHRFRAQACLEPAKASRHPERLRGSLVAPPADMKGGLHLGLVALLAVSLMLRVGTLRMAHSLDGPEILPNHFETDELIFTDIM